MPSFRKTRGPADGNQRFPKSEPMDPATMQARQLILSHDREKQLEGLKMAGETKDIGAIPVILQFLVHEKNDWEPAWDSLAEMGKPAIPRLLDFARDAMHDSIKGEAAMAIGCMGDRGVDCEEAKAPLLDLLKKADIDSDLFVTICRSLSYLGERRAAEYMVKAYHRTNSPEFIKYLGYLKFSEDEIQRMITPEARPGVLDTLAPWQAAAHSFILKHSPAKIAVLKGSESLRPLKDPQSWITINDPKLAKAALECALRTQPRGALDNALKASAGAKSGQLTDDHFTFFADEILDAVALQAKNSENPELRAIISSIKYGNGGAKLRYFRRELSDFSLGDKCGDCTARGSVNFGNSVMWTVNPAYQVLKLSFGSHFIGRVNLAFGSIRNEDAIIIDAVEFNPQAMEGKPYHEEAKQCFGKAMEFVKGLAKAQGRALYALTFSNSGGASELLIHSGRAICDASQESRGAVQVTAKLIASDDDIRKSLSSVRYSGPIKLFYQMLDLVDVIDLSKKAHRDLVDEKLPILEREVVNPAQLADARIGKALSEGHYDVAAERILADPGRSGKISEVFGLKGMKVGPAFLAKKLQGIYRVKSMDTLHLERSFTLDGTNFVKIL